MKQIKRILTLLIIVTILIPTLCPFLGESNVSIASELPIDRFGIRGLTTAQQNYIAKYVRIYLGEAHKMTPIPFVYDDKLGGYEKHYFQNEIITNCCPDQPYSYTSSELGQTGTTYYGPYSNRMRTVCSVFTGAMLHQALGVDIWVTEPRGAGFANPNPGKRGENHFNAVAENEVLQPGDIISYSDYSHSIIYIGKNPETGIHEWAQTNGRQEVVGISNLPGNPTVDGVTLTMLNSAWNGQKSLVASRLKPEVLDENWTVPETTKIQWPNGKITTWQGELDDVSTETDPNAPLFYAGLATKIGSLGRTNPIKTLIAKLEDAMDWLLGFMTAIIRVPFVGLTRVGELLISSIASAVSTENIEYALTLEKIIYNEISFFDVNIFKDSIENDVIATFKQSIAGWYVAFRNLVIVLLLAVLVYLGIRMVITSIAEEKAHYKRMLVDWLISFFLVLFIHYFIIIVMNVNDFLVEAFRNLVQGQDINTESFYEQARTLAHSMYFTEGWYGAILYIALVWYMAKYAWKYTKRVLNTFILIILSPFISLNYALDKIKDNRSQSLTKWLKEIAFTILIQSVHALIYTVFVVGIVSKLTTEGNFLQAIGVCVFLFIAIKFMDTAEKTFENIFKINSASTQEILEDTFEALGSAKMIWKTGKDFYKFNWNMAKGIGSTKFGAGFGAGFKGTAPGNSIRAKIGYGLGKGTGAALKGVGAATGAAVKGTGAIIGYGLGKGLGVAAKGIGSAVKGIGSKAGLRGVTGVGTGIAGFGSKLTSTSIRQNYKTIGNMAQSFVKGYKGANNPNARTKHVDGLMQQLEARNKTELEKQRQLRKQAWSKTIGTIKTVGSGMITFMNNPMASVTSMYSGVQEGVTTIGLAGDAHAGMIETNPFKLEEIQRALIGHEAKIMFQQDMQRLNTKRILEEAKANGATEAELDILLEIITQRFEQGMKVVERQKVGDIVKPLYRASFGSVKIEDITAQLAGQEKITIDNDKFSENMQEEIREALIRSILGERETVAFGKEAIAQIITTKTKDRAELEREINAFLNDPQKGINAILLHLRDEDITTLVYRAINGEGSFERGKEFTYTPQAFEKEAKRMITVRAPRELSQLSDFATTKIMPHIPTELGIKEEQFGTAFDQHVRGNLRKIITAMQDGKTDEVRHLISLKDIRKIEADLAAEGKDISALTEEELYERIQGWQRTRGNIYSNAVMEIIGDGDITKANEIIGRAMEPVPATIGEMKTFAERFGKRTGTGKAGTDEYLARLRTLLEEATQRSQTRPDKIHFIDDATWQQIITELQGVSPDATPDDKLQRLSNDTRKRIVIKLSGSLLSQESADLLNGEQRNFEAILAQRMVVIEDAVQLSSQYALPVRDLVEDMRRDFEQRKADLTTT